MSILLLKIIFMFFMFNVMFTSGVVTETCSGIVLVSLTDQKVGVKGYRLVEEHDVWLPHLLSWYSNNFNISVL